MRLVDRHPIDADAAARRTTISPRSRGPSGRSGARSRSSPRELHLVTIDGWFSQRWLDFSHKELGAVRFATMDLRVPPFVPSRVLTTRA
jgi:hypothetical protein